MSMSDHSIDRILGLKRACESSPAINRQQGRRRTLYSREARDKMEACFKVNPRPDLTTRQKFAMEFRVQEVKIQIWFQNRRSRRGQTKPRSQVTNRSTSATQGFPESCIPAPGYPDSSWYMYPCHPTRLHGMTFPYLTPTPSDWLMPEHLRASGNRLHDILKEELRTYEANSCDEDNSI